MNVDRRAWTEERMRAILAEAGLPEPDEVEYGETSIWLRWLEQKLVVEIDEIPDGPAPPFDPRDLEQPIDSYLDRPLDPYGLRRPAAAADDDRTPF